MLLKKTKRIHGLDIGSHSVKLISLEGSQNNILVDNFIIEKNQSRDNDGLLKEQIKKLNLDKEIVNVSVSGANVLIRYLSFPKMSQGELKNSLAFEAEKHIPFPISEVYLDSFILRDLEDKKMLVLVVAAKKSFIDERIKLIQGLGLNLGVIDVDSIALVNSFSFFNKDIAKDPVALLNIGAKVSNLSIIVDARPEFSRDLSFGGNSFSQSIAEKLSLTFDAAEELKCNPKDKAEQINPILEAILSNLSSEIRASFDYYENQYHAGIKKIFISGGGARLFGIDGFLQNYLGIPVANWDHLDLLRFKEGLNLEYFKNNKISFLLSFGLALRGLQK